MTKDDGQAAESPSEKFPMTDPTRREMRKIERKRAEETERAGLPPKPDSETPTAR